MDKKVFDIYKIPLLIAFTLFILLSAINTIMAPLQLSAVFIGSVLGIIVLDLEYIIYAYFIDPEKDYSRTLKAFIKHKDFGNLAKYIYYHTEDFRQKSLNSALFQVALAFFSIFAISSSESNLIKALILSVYAQLMYKLIRVYYENKIDEWFWAFKNRPEMGGVALFTLALSIVFIYLLYLF